MDRTTDKADRWQGDEMDEGWGEANGEALNQIPGGVLELSAECWAASSTFVFFF